MKKPSIVKFYRAKLVNLKTKLRCCSITENDLIEKITINHKWVFEQLNDIPASQVNIDNRMHCYCFNINII